MNRHHFSVIFSSEKGADSQRVLLPDSGDPVPKELNEFTGGSPEEAEAYLRFIVLEHWKQMKSEGSSPCWLRVTPRCKNGLARVVTQRHV